MPSARQVMLSYTKRSALGDVYEGRRIAPNRTQTNGMAGDETMKLCSKISFREMWVNEPRIHSMKISSFIAVAIITIPIEEFRTTRKLIIVLEMLAYNISHHTDQKCSFTAVTSPSPTCKLQTPCNSGEISNHDITTEFRLSFPQANCNAAANARNG